MEHKVVNLEYYMYLCRKIKYIFVWMNRSYFFNLKQQ